MGHVAQQKRRSNQAFRNAQAHIRTERVRFEVGSPGNNRFSATTLMMSSEETAPRIELSLVIPCYNEAAVLPLLERRLLDYLATLGASWEVILVDDGSSDGTGDKLSAMHASDSRFKVVRLSRNFGHQAAICAGLAYSTGEATGIMDADLQDPPEVFAEALEKIRTGYDVVYAVRRKRKEHFAKRAAYKLFYRLLTIVAEVDIPLDSGDFCLMKRRVVSVLTHLPERNVFLRGLRAWSGFKQIGLEYERDARQAGEPKYSFRKLVRLAMDGMLAFSTLPLRLATYLGFLALAFSTACASFILIWRFAGFRFMGSTARELPGWTAIAVGMFFLSGVQFLILGVMGEYIGRIYTEVKQRPRWIVSDALGLSTSSSEQRVKVMT
jgi:polyisoprenyl-phosphate glycosyltransferase